VSLIGHTTRHRPRMVSRTRSGARGRVSRAPKTVYFTIFCEPLIDEPLVDEPFENQATEQEDSIIDETLVTNIL
jgi:hypothetical protein